MLRFWLEKRWPAVSRLRSLPVLASFLVLVTSGSQAQQRSYAVADALGNVLASEKLCKLQYNQQAIKTFIDAHVQKDDMKFPGTLAMKIRIYQTQNETMSGSAKTAHCAQIERVARSFGLIQ
jgi:hypothetical protein